MENNTKSLAWKTLTHILCVFDTLGRVNIIFLWPYEFSSNIHLQKIHLGKAENVPTAKDKLEDMDISLHLQLAHVGPKLQT